MFLSTLVSSSPVQTTLPAASQYGDKNRNTGGGTPAIAIKKTRSLRETITARVGSFFESGNDGKKGRHLSEPIPESKFSSFIFRQRASAPAILNAEEVNPDSNLVYMIQQAVTCPIHKELLLSLRDERAADTLLLMQKVGLLMVLINSAST